MIWDEVDLPDTEESLAVFVLAGKKFFSFSEIGKEVFVDYETYYVTLLHISMNLWLVKDAQMNSYDKLFITIAGTNEYTTLNRFDSTDRALFTAIIQHYGFETV